MALVRRLPKEALAPRSVAGIAARGARRQNGVASKWRRKGLKRLNPRPEMVVARKPRGHKIWYAGARLTVRDSGKNDKAAELQKKVPNALKSPDAELKSAPSHTGPRGGRSSRVGG